MILSKEIVKFFKENLPAGATRLIAKKLADKGVSVNPQMVYKVLGGERSDLVGVSDAAFELLYDKVSNNTAQMERISGELKKQLALKKEVVKIQKELESIK